MTAIGIECDGGPSCLAAEHIDGCFAITRRHAQRSHEPPPFPIKRLVDALHQVQACSAAVDRNVYGMLLNQPRSPELWAYEMHHLAGMLFSLAQSCHDAERAVERLADG